MQKFPMKLRTPPNSSHSHSPSPSSEGGVLWVIGQTGFLAAVAIAAPLWSGDWPKAVSIGIGTVAFLYAASTGLAGVARLGRNRTPLPAPRSGSVLITSGIYGIIRHPLYAAMMAMSVGWACFWSSGIALLIAAAFIGFLHAKTRVEERLLCRAFQDYPSYAVKVPRYLPKWPNPTRRNKTNT
jgi:protein-S-isoprenylcysteine O-methyltransferase Ste14